MSDTKPRIIKNILIFFMFLVVCLGSYWLWGVVAPFLISLVIAYILNPLVVFVENIKILRAFSFLKKLKITSNWYEKHKEFTISKALAVLAVFCACLTLFVIVVIPVVFSISHDISFFAEKIQQADVKEFLTIEKRTLSSSKPLLNSSAPQSKAAAASETERIWIFDFDKLLKEYPEFNKQLAQLKNILPEDEIAGHLVKAASFVKEVVVKTTKGLLSFFAGAVSKMVNMMLVPILVFYILIDYNGISHGFKALIPPNCRAKTLKILDEIDVQLGKLLRGMLISNSIFALLMIIGLGLCKMKFFVSLGILAGIANFVPYLGGLFTAVLSILVAAMMQLGFKGFILKTVALAVVVIVVQSIDGWYLQPYVVGGGVGLSPLVIMLALALAGAVGGIPGMLLAVPCAVIVKIVGIEIYNELYDRA